MSLAPDDFDPLAVVIDWLDACRSGDLDALLDLYEERATLECGCEGARLTGREPLSAYWTGKLQNQLPTAFTLDDLTVTEDGIWVDYRNNKASLVRAHFRFSPSGKIETHPLWAVGSTSVGINHIREPSFSLSGSNADGVKATTFWSILPGTSGNPGR